RAAEQRASQPTFAPTLTPQATAIPNEMLLMALSAVPSATLGVTLTPTVEVSSSAATVWTFTAHCDQAWTILQAAQPRAQAIADDAMVADIQLGLSLVSRDCPAYLGAAPTLDWTPTYTPTPTVELLTTDDITPDAMDAMEG
ncbi:MAG: hypothetical protein H7Y11_04740, partial [Armatimonadetes bacterium]|nr:hypothetical protein [Anaerolineae bacterium]